MTPSPRAQDRAERGYLAARAAHDAGMSAVRDAVVTAAYPVRRRGRVPRPVNMDALYDFIVDYKQSHDGNAPTVREMCAAVDVSAPSVMWSALRRLEKAGLVRIVSGKAARSVEVVGGHWTLERQP